MYFRLATGYLPFAPEGFYDWPIVTSSLQSVAFTDVADQWMAFVGAHDVNAVVVADGPQSLPLTQMLAALKVSPLKMGGVLLYQVRPETLAPYANLTSVDMEARENDLRFSELLIAAHKYLSDGGDPARLTLGVAVQWGLLPGEWSAPQIQKTNYMVWLNAEQGGRIDVELTGHYEALRPLIKALRSFCAKTIFPAPSPAGMPSSAWRPRPSIATTGDGLRQQRDRPRRIPCDDGAPQSGFSWDFE